MKHYKKFYEIGYNRYYTIIADDEEYLATESFLPIGKRRLFGKQKDLITGFKVLKFSPVIAQLFNALNDLKPSKKQKYDSDDLITYGHINNKKLKESIKDAYYKVIEDAKNDMLQQKTELIRDGKDDLVKDCDKYLDSLEHVNPMEGIDLDVSEHTVPMIIKTMLREGLEHLFNERINAFTNNVYLYEQDIFGTLTIYKIIIIKNVVKSIDTFIYDKKLVECLLKTLYEEGR